MTELPGTVAKEVFSFQTPEGEWSIENITDRVAAAIRIQDGFVLVHTPHTSASILVGEEGEALREDYHRVGTTLLAAGRPYKHESHGHKSGEAHQFTTLHGPQRLLPVENGQLALSPTQSVFFVDPTEGPRDRDVWVYSFGKK
jgi:secondary thiamine-phosphate synthase enzyme